LLLTAKDDDPRHTVRMILVAVIVLISISSITAVFAIGKL
jgi:hypothetical protein